MRKMILIISLIIIALITAIILYMNTPRYLAFGYKTEFSGHNFVIFGVDKGMYLRKSEDLLYLNLNKRDEVNIYSIENYIQKNQLITAFKELNDSRTVSSIATYPENGIYLYNDTNLTERSSGSRLVSFYIGNEIDSNIIKRHNSLRDSILTELN